MLMGRRTKVSGHFLSLFSLILFIFVTWKARALHINMLILNTYGVLLGALNAVTRLLLIAIETNILELSGD
ncbi:hypothetical protein PFISCL1PPCAC_13085, partial [Pristionchus fissidentatus]